MEDEKKAVTEVTDEKVDNKDIQPTPEKKEPEKTEEKQDHTKKAEDEKGEEVKVDVEKLKQELQDANEKVKEVEGLTATIETMKADVEAQKSTIAEYEKLVGNLVEEKMKQLPEQYRDLMPDNLELKQKLAWLEKAEAKGLFNKEEKKKPDVEIGKPMNVDIPQVDTSKLTGSQLLKMAYNTIKK